MRVSRKDILAIFVIVILVGAYFLKDEETRSWILWPIIFVTVSWMLWRLENGRRNNPTD